MGKRTDWRDAYQSRLMAVDDALKLIHEGDLVKLNVGTPPEVAALLDQRARELDVMHFRSLAPGYLPIVETPIEAGEHEIEIFIGDPFRPSHDAKRTTYLPTTFMLGLKAFDAGRPEARIPDVNVVLCSAPNEGGLRPLRPHALASQVLPRTLRPHDRLRRPEYDAGPRRRLVARLGVQRLRRRRGRAPRPTKAARTDRDRVSRGLPRAAGPPDRVDPSRASEFDPGTTPVDGPRVPSKAR